MRKTLAVASLALLGTFALAGCSSIDDAVHQVTELSFADYAEAKDGWPGVFPAWLPEDATDIHIRTTNDGKVAMLAADTEGAPTGSDCEDTERHQLAVWETDWSPEKFMPDRVIACGDWETMPTDDGIFAWYTEQ